jgi:hypothetical protein
MERQTAAPEPDDGAVSFLTLEAILCAGENCFAKDGSLGERAACHFPAADSGRQVRALIESYLL